MLKVLRGVGRLSAFNIKLRDCLSCPLILEYILGGLGYEEPRSFLTAVHLLYGKHPTCVSSLRLPKLFQGVQNNDKLQLLT